MKQLASSTNHLFREIIIDNFAGGGASRGIKCGEGNAP